MLHLLQSAYEACQGDPIKMDLLGALLDDSGRALSRMLDEPGAHDALGDDAFFEPWICLAGAQASKNFWQALAEYGYDFNTRITHTSEKGDHSYSLGEWVAVHADIERLNYLVDQTRMLHPLDVAHDKKVCLAEVGMLRGDAAHFEYWRARWPALIQQQLDETTRKTRYAPSAPMVPVAVEYLLGKLAQKEMAPLDAHIYGTHEEIQRRLDVLVEAFLSLHYGPSQERWKNFLSHPPTARTGLQGEHATVALCQYIAKHTDNAFGNAARLREVSRKRPVLLAGLMRAGAPLDCVGLDEVLPALALRLRKSHKESRPDAEAHLAWGACIQRLEKERPEVWTQLPEPMRSRSVGARLAQEVDYRAQIDALALGLSSPSAPSSRVARRI